MNFLNSVKNMGRILVLFLFLAVATLPLLAESVEINGIYYNLNNQTNTAAVTNQSTSSDNYESLQPDVKIPEKITFNGNTYTVTEIEVSAFANCNTIESISIPATVSLIDTPAPGSYQYQPFYACDKLKCVRLEDGDTPIQLGSLKFGHVGNAQVFTSLNLFGHNLEEVYIGRDINYGPECSWPFETYNYAYGYSPFYDQPNLTKVIIGSTVSEIPSYLFYKNESMTVLNLPNVETIGSHAFEGCLKLTTLDLGNRLKSINDRSFYGCTNLTKLTFPNTVESIGNESYYDCSSVTEITVGSGLRSIGASAFKNCGSFTAVVLPDQFTSMGESAFENCEKLTIAKLGQSLTAVPARAFKNCTSLSEMEIPSSAVSIGDQAFYDDSGLATITMNEGLETIGKEVFWNNSGIMRFQIPGTVTSMGQNCFFGCSRVTYLIFMDGIETLTIDNTNTKTSQHTHTRKYDYFGDCPIRFLTLGRNLTYFSENVPASAPFVDHKELVSVTLGKYVTFLYNHLFNGCSGIKSLIMPEGMQSIYPYALANCSSINELSFPNPLILLGDHACENDTNLATVVFNEAPGNDLDFIIGEYAFKNCPALTSLVFPSKTTSIGNYCFYDTQNLKDIVFSDSYKTITLGYGAKNYTNKYEDQRMPLFGNSTLNHLYIGRNIDYRTNSYGNLDKERAEYGYSPFYNQTFLTDVKFSLSDHVTFCKDFLLYRVNNCEDLVLPESLKTIGDYTFAGMTILKGITIPNAVTEIGIYAFAYDLGLKYAHLSNSCPWLKYGLFSNCESLAGITIPPVVTKMDNWMFENCTSLASATFEGSNEGLVMGFGANNSEEGLFRDCPLETLNLDRWLTYNTDQPERAPFCHIAELKNLTLGVNVGVIDKYMFSYCTGLEEVYLPDNITSVGLWGFRGCSSLKSVRFSKKLSQVSDYGFSECTSLDNVVFPTSMTSIADNSFSNCTSLKKLDLGNSLNIIGPSAFENDSALDGIVIPETLYGLGVRSFANCTSLPYVEIRAITSVGKQAFQGCTGLQWISLSDKTTSLGEDSFAECPKIGYVKSYAEFPPEGLVNFVESVPADGTLFVPQNSIDYYATSPTWENWKNIRPLNDDILASSLTINLPVANAKVGNTVQLTATVGPSDASNKQVEWTSSSEAIATVDENGLVTALSIGETVITAMCVDGSGLKAECLFTVDPVQVESIEIDVTEATLHPEDTLTLVATVLPEDATDKTVVWSSSYQKVCIVEKNGLVRALSPGKCDIVATAADGSGVSAVCKITVEEPVVPVKAISLDTTDATLHPEDTLALVATVLPEDATDKTVVWSSSDEEVCTVDENGLVRALAPGVCDIVASAADESGISAVCRITVEEIIVPVKAISLDTTDATLHPEDTLALVATVLPEDATDKTVVWSSSDEKVCAVDENGLVRALAPGVCDIVATAADESGVSAVCRITVEEYEHSLNENIVEVNGIYYRVDPSTGNAKVIGASDDDSVEPYTDLIEATIVATVKYNDREYDVTSISDMAFKTAKRLESVIIEESSVPIDVNDETFKDSYNYHLPIQRLSILRPFNVTSNYFLFTQRSLEELVIAGKATWIGNYWFYRSSALKSITLGENVSYIGLMAFYECNAIENVTSKAMTPPVLERYCFENSTYTSATLFVPEASVEAYRNAYLWKDFYDVRTLEGDTDVDIVEKPKSVTVYTADGLLINKAATPDDISRLSKGMYIIDGEKVIIR